MPPLGHFSQNGKQSSVQNDIYLKAQERLHVVQKLALELGLEVATTSIETRGQHGLSAEIKKLIEFYN